MSAGHRDDAPNHASERSASDEPPPDDPIERLGKRIGRILSYLLAAALVLYLWHTYLRG